MVSLIRRDWVKATIAMMLLLRVSEYSIAQNVDPLKYFNILDDKLPRTIIDPKTQVKFTLDSSHIYVEARDKNGRALWKTDAWKDNKLPAYRFERPLIIDFSLSNDKHTNFQDAIVVEYESTQTGYLNIHTGRFRFIGQD